MSGELEKYRAPLPERLSSDELKFIQNSQLLPAAYRGKPADIFACVLLGRQLGIGDMHALRSIYVVDGKATIGAELMVMLIRRAGHSITAEYVEGAVTVTGRRADNGDEMSVTWTLEMARRAELTSKNNWKRYPESMLWARAVSQLCRMLFPDALAGLSHTPEEAELSPEDRVVEGIGVVVPPADHDGPDDGHSTDGRADSQAGPMQPAGGSRALPLPDGGSVDEAPGMGARTPAPPDIDDADVIEGHAVLVDESEGEPQAGRERPDAPSVSPAGAAPEPGSPSEQGSIFTQMAEQAQTRKRRGVAD